MSMEIKGDGPLTPAERQYLADRNRQAEIDRIDTQYPPKDTEVPQSQNDSWTPANSLSLLSADELQAELDRRKTAADEAEDGETPYEEWTVKELDAELRDRDLPTTGKPADKAARLRADDSKAL
jgi:hypothetical protein